jgi:hypothetical protein
MNPQKEANMSMVEAEVVETEENVTPRTHEEIMARLANEPTVEYPEAFIKQLDRESEIIKAQIASGELVPKTADEVIAELGIILDD